MKSFVTALAVLASTACIAAVVGCAEGTADDLDPSESFLTTTPAEAGASDDDSVTIPAPSNPSKPADTSDAGASKDGGNDSGTSDAGGNTGVACTSSNTCATATNLGEVRGDNGGDVKTAQGHTSQWFTIRVKEDDNSIDGEELSVQATLTSPAGADFNLFLYVPNGDTKECTAVSQQSTSTSGTDTAQAKFGESGTFSNGSDDSRTVTVEVRHVSGTCDPSKTWTLTVTGNK